MNPNEDILSFYGWWQMSVCFFAFVGLMAIWYHLGRKQKDHGQVWLALSVLCWSVSGLIELISINSNNSNLMYLNGGRSIFSLLNSLFILLSLPWFRHLPKLIQPIIKSKYWSIIVGLPFVFSLLPTMSILLSGKSSGFISELDVYYSILTLIFLGMVLFESFSKRRLEILAYLSVICILITFAAQLYKLTDMQINLTLFSAIFKTCLIMIFFALALSWVKDLSENIRLSPSLFKLSLFKSENKLSISGVNGDYNNSDVILTDTYFKLLDKFVTRKIQGDGWLEIKPKNDPRSGKVYDITDHNQLKRLLHAILDSLYGKGNWTKEQHLNPLRKAFFEMSEKRERKVRLAIDREQISVSE